MPNKSAKMNGNRRIMLSVALSAVLLMASTSTSNAFMSSSRTMSSSLSSTGTIRQVESNFMGRSMRLSQRPTTKKSSNSRKGTELGMFLGTDGGILGVGTPEVVSVIDQRECENFFISILIIFQIC